jgi:hypothetical protein
MKTLAFLFFIPLLALADQPAVHGMLVFGKTQVYLSHLPMFHAPHDYQLIAELELPSAALEIYRQSLAQYPEETIYTLVPERLALPDLVAHPHPFHADLYRGHFERGGTVIAGGLTVNLGNVLYWKKFVPGARKPDHAVNILLGSPTEAFLAHYIVAKPDYDQVLELGQNAAAVAGSTVIVDSTAQLFDQPLKAGQQLRLLPRDGSAAIDADVHRELYLETDDLSE